MSFQATGVSGTIMSWSAYQFFMPIVGCICCVCVNLLADHVLFNGYSIVVRVLCDELAHWTSSAYVWAAACSTSPHRKYALLAFLCDELAPKALTNLKRHPFFHITTFTASANVLLYLLLRRTPYGYMTALAFSSWFPHQVRDANRHGFMLYPFRDTSPISQPFYLFLLTLAAPIATFLLLQVVTESQISTTLQIV
ncbi:hypothetical protein M513_02304, partial [Trichuris suis]